MPTHLTEADMMDAVKAGDAARVRALLDADPALLYARDADGNSAVLIATYWRKNEVLAALLEREPSLNVFEAAAVGQLERVRSLVGGAPSLARSFSRDGFTALHLACFFAHAPVAFFLLDKSDVNAVATNGTLLQPLHSAAAANDLAICMALLTHGADANARQQGGFTPLHEAAHNGNATLVRLLLGMGADLHAKTDDGKTARDFAVESKNDEAVGLLS